MATSVYDDNCGLAKCSKHSGNLNIFCADCVKFVCNECKPSHHNHKLRSTINDNDVYTDASIQLVDSLLEGIKHVESYRQLMQGIVKAYSDAIDTVDGWEKDLLAYVSKKAHTLRDNLKKGRVHYEKILNEMSVQQALTKVDDELKRIPMLRKPREDKCAILSQKLARTQKMVEQLNEYQKQLTELVVPKVDQIIPIQEGLDAAKSNIDDVFDANPRETKAEFKPQILNLIAECDIGNKFKVCRSNRRGKIILYGENTTEICDFNIDTNQLEDKSTADVNIWRMVETSTDEYIAIDSSMYAIHLLDKHYHKISTEKCDTNKYIPAVAYLSQHRFVKLEITNYGPHKAYISVMTVKNKKLVTEKTIIIDSDKRVHYMFVHNDNKVNVTIGGFENRYTINIESGASTKYDVSHENKWGDEYYSVIECVSENELKPRIVTNVPGGTVDMVERNGRVYVTTYDSPQKMLTYA